MKRIKTILILALSVLLLSGCGAVNFEITSSSKKANIKMSDVEDGTFAEISTMSVSKGKTVHIESSLNKGKLKIEFAEAIEVSSTDEEDEFVAGNIVETVEVGPGEKLELSIDPGRYVVQLTTLGQTEGTADININ